MLGQRSPSVERRSSPRTYGRDPSLLDPIAPDWVVRILAPRKAVVPWVDMVRCMLTVPPLLGAGLLLGQPGLAVFAGMGGMVGAFGDNGGTFRARFRRVLLGGGGGLLGLLVGRYIEQGVAAVLAFALLGVVSALLSSVSSNLSFASLQLLVYAAVAAALPQAVGVHVVAGAYLAGLAWSVALSFVQTRLDPQENQPRAVEIAVLSDLARELRRPPEAPDPVAVHDRRAALTRELSQAVDEIVTARSTSAGRRDDLRRLSSALTATFSLVTAVFDLQLRAPGTRSGIADLVDRLAALVGQRRDRAVRGELDTLEDDVDRAAAEDVGAQPVLTALTQVVRTVEGRAASPSGSDRPSWASYVPARKAWVFAARLAVTMAVAETVRLLVPLEKPYWIVLTAALVLKPDFGSMFARGVQRTLGTLVGVAARGRRRGRRAARRAAAAPDGRAGLRLPVREEPQLRAAVDVPHAARAAAHRLRHPRRRPGGPDRLLDTVIGAGVVLVVGYLWWPGTWHPRLGETSPPGRRRSPRTRGWRSAPTAAGGACEAEGVRGHVGHPLRAAEHAGRAAAGVAAGGGVVADDRPAGEDDGRPQRGRGTRPAPGGPATRRRRRTAGGGVRGAGGGPPGAPGTPGPAAARLSPARRPGRRPGRPGGHRPGTDRCLSRARPRRGRGPDRARARRLATAGRRALRRGPRRDRPCGGHALWRTGRDALFAEHPQSPLPPGSPLRETGLPCWPYDPACGSRSRSPRCPSGPARSSCRAGRRAAPG